MVVLNFSRRLATCNGRAGGCSCFCCSWSVEEAPFSVEAVEMEAMRVGFVEGEAKDRRVLGFLEREEDRRAGRKVEKGLNNITRSEEEREGESNMGPDHLPFVRHAESAAAVSAPAPSSGVGVATKIESIDRTV